MKLININNFCYNYDVPNCFKIKIFLDPGTFFGTSTTKKCFKTFHVFKVLQQIILESEESNVLKK